MQATTTIPKDKKNVRTRKIKFEISFGDIQTMNFSLVECENV